MVFKSWLLNSFFFTKVCAYWLLAFPDFWLYLPEKEKFLPGLVNVYLCIFFFIKIFMFIYWCEWTIHFVTTKYHFSLFRNETISCSIQLEIPSQFSTQVTVFCLWMTQFCYFNLFIIFLYFSFSHSSVISSLLLLRWWHGSVVMFAIVCLFPIFSCVFASVCVFSSPAFAFICCRFN